MKKISLAMIVKNEMKHLARCIKSVKDIIDEIVIVDTGSTDLTKEIALKHDAKVFSYKWNNSFADARNFSLNQATGDWCLVLDADEFLPEQNKGEIRNFIENYHGIGRLKIVSKYIDNGEQKSSFAYVSRLFPRDVRYSGRIHEQIVSDLPHYRLPIIVNHDGYLTHNEEKAQRNISLLQEEYTIDSENPYIIYQLAKEYKRAKKREMAFTYFNKAYKFLNGSEGYFPVFAVDYIYLLIETDHFKVCDQVIKECSPILDDYPDFHFARGLFTMNYLIKGGLTDPSQIYWIEESFRKCLSIGETDKYDSVIGTGSFLAYYNLGVFYEVVGKIQDAIACYKMSSQHDYGPAAIRLRRLNIPQSN
ncbi:glycosyltransferase family 2 protein [Brevibacillus brevis]|uniref:Glycosyltransferase family 2 protein n=1 Tax=Brevibacillus brevis TaxID=1393 RepID=A0ABY9T2Z5_BREBE|nr:glycosyltransferase family 2 protein [Brevibacillus brevis]WNC14461.1 glycosyltransferase family 2 protein [Brevibacillus brevis]